MLLLSSRNLNLTKNIVSCRTYWPARFGVASFDRMNFLTCDRDVLLPQARYTPAVTSVSVGRRADPSQQRRANFSPARGTRYDVPPFLTSSTITCRRASATFLVDHSL